MKKIINTLLCALTITSAYATEKNVIAPIPELPWNQHIGNFIDLNVGTNAYYLGIFTSNGKATHGDISGIGWSGAFGHNYTSKFGLEGGVIQNFIRYDDSHYITAPYFSTRFTVPIGTRWAFIGKVGAMIPIITHEGGVLLPYTSLGGSYAITKSIDLSFQYQGAIYGVVGAGLLGAGLTFHL